MTQATKTYSLVFSIIYITAFATAVFIYRLQLADLLTTFLFVGMAFSVLALLLTQKTLPAFIDKPAFKNESLILAALIIWIVLYITFGGDFINSLLPKNILQNKQWQFFVIIVRKLFVFVLIPYLIYRALGFSLNDFGLSVPILKAFTKRNVLLLVAMSLAILLF